MRLNGWQRLWVLIAGIWTLLVASFVIDVGVGSPLSTFAWWGHPSPEPLCPWVGDRLGATWILSLMRGR